MAEERGIVDAVELLDGLRQQSEERYQRVMRRIDEYLAEVKTDESVVRDSRRLRLTR
jgi:hypothetical protein